MQEELDVRWKQRFSNYKKALERLCAAADLAEERPLSDLEVSGFIKSFEFSFELSWNVMKDYLSQQGISGIIGSKGAIRHAFSNGLIEDGENWMQMIFDRNLASHTYDEATAKKLSESIKALYIPLFKQFEQKMESLCGEG